MKKIQNLKKLAICYIDGFNLYYGIRALGKPYKWLDVQALAESFLPHDTELVAVKYFTSRVKKGKDKRFRQRQYLAALEAHCNKLEIIYGHFQVRNRQCDNCGKITPSFEEKKTDANIACELLADTYENRFDIAYVVTGDSDLVPPVVHTIKKGKPVIVVSPPNRKSVELKERATGHIHTHETQLKNCLLPTTVQTPKGIITCPEEWMRRF